MHYISEVYWDKGGRSVNQDSVSLQEVNIRGKKILFALICDGIGGLEDGESASGYVAERMTEWFYKEALLVFIRKKSGKCLLKSGLRALYGCNEEIRRVAETANKKMGTTATAMILWGRKYFLWHSGDTRAYLFRERRRGRQLTTDHTADLHTLLRCIGSFVWKQPDVVRGYLKRGDVLLLCSDGFRNQISAERIEETLQPSEMETRERIYMRLSEIADYVKRHGEKDNISAVAVKVE